MPEFSFTFTIDGFSIANFFLLLLMLIRRRLAIQLIRDKKVASVRIGGMDFFRGEDY